MPRAFSEDLFCRDPFGISIFKRAIESARQKTGKGHQVSCRLKPPHSIKFVPRCHRAAHAKLRDCPFFSPVTLRGSFSTLPAKTLIGLNKPLPSPLQPQPQRTEASDMWLQDLRLPPNHSGLGCDMTGTEPLGGEASCWVWGKGRRAREGGWDFSVNVCLASSEDGGVRPARAVWQSKQRGPHGGRFQRWGRCAYTVEFSKPADPEGTEGAAPGGEAELQGAA